MRDRFWLSDEAWAVLEPHLPMNQPGRRRVDDRRVLSRIAADHAAAVEWLTGNRISDAMIELVADEAFEAAEKDAA